MWRWWNHGGCCTTMEATQSCCCCMAMEGIGGGSAVGRRWRRWSSYVMMAAAELLLLCSDGGVGVIVRWRLRCLLHFWPSRLLLHGDGGSADQNKFFFGSWGLMNLDSSLSVFIHGWCTGGC